MARPRRIDPKMVAQAKHLVAEASNLRELRAAQSVLLPAVLGATLEQTAALLGVGRASVVRLQACLRRSRHKPKSPRHRWGGRRRALMSWEEEKVFLTPWLGEAKAGSMLVVSPLRAALAQKLGRPVAASVVYRLLARHGWRKVAPDTRHPKSNPQIQEDWKKNFRKRWRAS